jgi:hypothetical protein
VLGGVVVGLVVAALMFAWVAWHEFSYAHDHPYAYGPANVIGVAGVAGAIVAICLLLVITKDREERRD